MHYFDVNLGAGEIRLGEPSVEAAERAAVYEYTGLIEISGEKTGQIYFSSPVDLIRHLLVSMGEEELGDELVADLVGEIANSIAGNARSHFGQGFCLSTPIILRDPARVYETSRGLTAYVVPLIWRDNTSNIVVWFK